jgi:hypothetical protein
MGSCGTCDDSIPNGLDVGMESRALRPMHDSGSTSMRRDAVRAGGGLSSLSAYVADRPLDAKGRFRGAGRRACSTMRRAHPLGDEAPWRAHT